MARPRLISDEEILGQVRRSVLELGSRVSLDVVAEQLGVTAPALFKRFGSRNALLLAALRPTRPAFLDVLEPGPDGRPLAEQLVDLFEMMGGWFAEATPAVMALHESGVPMCDVHGAFEEALPVAIVRAMTRWLRRAEQAGVVRVPDAEATAMAMMGALQSRTIINHFLRRQAAATRDLRRDAQRLAALFIEGIRPTAVIQSPRAPRTRGLTKPKRERA